MLRHVDEAILARVERFCHWFQRLTGLTNFWWARWMTALAFMFIAVAMLHAPTMIWPVMAANASLGWMYVVVSVPMYTRVERYYFTGATAAHPYTLVWRNQWPIRPETLFFMFVLALFSFKLPRAFMYAPLGYIGAMLALLMATYSRCVIPLPPGTSKVRQFMESLRPVPQQILVPAR